MKTCGVCKNASRGRRRAVYVPQVTKKGARLARALACPACFADAVHIVAAPPLQLTRGGAR